MQAGNKMNRRIETLETLNKLHIAVVMYLAKHIICNITKLLLSTNPIPNVA